MTDELTAELLEVQPHTPEYVHQAKAERDRAEAAKLAAETREAVAKADKAELDLEREREKRRDELAAHKHHYVLPFSGPVNDQSATAAVDQLTKWRRQAAEPLRIEMLINSPGGGITAGFTLIDVMRAMRAEGHHITTTSYGLAASMGGVILQAGDLRRFGRHAQLLIHQASFGAGGSMGNVEDQVEWVKMMQEQILDLFAERSKMTKATIKRRWHRKDWWISAADALKYGFVDEVV